MRKNDRLQTPKHIYEALGPFDLDPCGGLDTAIAATNWAIERGENGLILDWFGLVWCNPPFSEKSNWIHKMRTYGNGILLLPERASAPWFGPLAEAAGTYFIMGKKINFIGGSSSNNLGSCLFPFGQLALERIIQSDLPGLLVEVKQYRRRK